MKSREISRSKIGPFSLAGTDPYIGIGSEYQSTKALEGFKPLRSLITLSLEITISFMKGADLSSSRTWVCSFLAEAIRTTVMPISILISTTVVPIRILIRTTGM